MHSTDIVKIAAVAAAGLAATWAGGQLTGDAAAPVPTVLAQADHEPPPEADSTAPPDAESPAIEELTPEEIEAELERVEQALGEDDELEEFVPSKPLAADIPIALPSDI